MNFKLNRYEKNRDTIGNIVAIFVEILITDPVSKEYASQQYFLSPNEVKSVLKDETTLTPILNRLADYGQTRLQQYILTKPLPPIFADRAKCDSFIIDPTSKNIVHSINGSINTALS